MSQLSECKVGDVVQIEIADILDDNGYTGATKPLIATIIAISDLTGNYILSWHESEDDQHADLLHWKDSYNKVWSKANFNGYVLGLPFKPKTACTRIEHNKQPEEKAPMLIGDCKVGDVVRISLYELSERGRGNGYVGATKDLTATIIQSPRQGCNYILSWKDEEWDQHRDLEYLRKNYGTIYIEPGFKGYSFGLPIYPKTPCVLISRKGEVKDPIAEPSSLSFLLACIAGGAALALIGKGSSANMQTTKSKEGTR